jgi:hypothetical protein
MKKHFDAFEQFLKDTAGVRASHRQLIAKLEAERTRYGDQYGKDFIDPKIKEAKEAMAVFNQAAYLKAGELVQALTAAAVARHAEWPGLTDPKMASALQIISLAGGKLDGDTTRKIVKSFIGDDQSLRVLRMVFENQGIKYDGGLSNLIYDPEQAGESLNQFAYHSLMQEGSLNEFASAVSKIAKREGFDFPQIIDQAGSDNALRAAAGLPIQ